jgi:hypothetical protein
MMPDQEDDTNTTDEGGQEKPTITIAEKQAGKTSEEDAKPTITIAERGKVEDDE